MKKVLLSIIGILVFTTLPSQERINKQIPTIIEKSVDLTEAIGWKLNSSGTWIENKNVICDRVCPDYWISHESSNFNWIHMIKINYNGAIFYALLRESKSGIYNYPTIQKDWVDEMRTYYLVFTEKDYNTFIKQFQKKSLNALRLKNICESNINNRFAQLGGENEYNEENLLKRISTNIDQALSRSGSYDIGLAVKIVNDKIRFTITCSSKKPEEALSKEYYEVDYSEFAKLIIE